MSSTASNILFLAQQPKLEPDAGKLGSLQLLAAMLNKVLSYGMGRS